ncbi:MAG: hypothetical protein ACRDEA_07460 [Microcystaceae cyanobacterium]
MTQIQAAVFLTLAFNLIIPILDPWGAPRSLRGEEAWLSSRARYRYPANEKEKNEFLNFPSPRPAQGIG